ncbi:class I SAM-dependent methyltransferase [Cognatitamlana onchidii]|uniref:class I SAM-dependent methyltransferase n=1 Tax=Cognatitamlana onchidii TaxID=2562860 RepID=UPI0010A5F59E|nr:class I SAM-dependent methyltransferase [Algibacter onchidii]
MKGDYYKTEASVKAYIELAKNVNGGTLIELLKDYLPLDSKVLEIGSGPGTDWRILNTYFQVIGSDNSDEFINHLKTQNVNGEFLNLDATTLTIKDRFDGIYSNKVLHHLTNDQLSQSIKRQCQILNDSGIICHSFWKGEDSEIFKGLFVNYHDKPDLVSFYKDSFNILYLEYYEEFETDDSILLIAKKK